MKTLFRFALLPALLAVLTAVIAPGAEPTTRWRNIARTKLPQGVAAMALEYTVLFVEDGVEKAIDPATHKFAIGDQFLVRIEAKDDMYIYIFTEGPTGDKDCLQPTEEEKPPMVKKGAKIDLPGDGFFQFAPPPGEEKFIVVATLEPSKDLAALSNVVFRKPDQLLTPAEQVQKKAIVAQVEKALTTTESKPRVKSRGILSDQSLNKFTQELKTKNRGTFEEPPHNGEKSTFAMAVSKPEAGKPELLINISLKSSEPGKAKAR